LAGRELAEIVASQWEISLRELLDSLDALPRERWIAVDYGRLVENPQAELERVCAWAGLAWDRRLGGQLPLSRYTLSPPASDKWQRHAALIEPQLAAREALLRRAQTMAAY
jgi:hypothetical protein